MDSNSRQFGSEKMFVHADRIAANQRGELMSPVTVELDLTNLCNHGCDGCTFSYLVNISKDNFPYERAESLVDELGTLGVRALTFSGGGEPLLYGQDRVLKLMSLAMTHGMDTALITNGSLLTPDDRYRRCQWVRVSLDAYDADTFQRFHGRNIKEFDKVVGRVKDFAATKLGPTVGVGFLTDSGTIGRGDVRRMAEFCAGLGVHYLQFRPLVIDMVADPTMRGGRKEWVDGDAILEEVRRAAEEFGTDAYKVVCSAGKYDALERPTFGREYDRCLAHFLEATVSADQRVYICCHGQGQSKFCLGDLRDSTFDAVWRSDAARSVYESIDPRRDCPPACRLHLQNAALHDLSNMVHRNFV